MAPVRSLFRFARVTDDRAVLCVVLRLWSSIQVVRARTRGAQFRERDARRAVTQTARGRRESRDSVFPTHGAHDTALYDFVLCVHTLASGVSVRVYGA